MTFAAGALILSVSVLGNAAVAGPAAAAHTLRKPAAVLATLPASAPMPSPAGVGKALAGLLADPGLGGAPHVEVLDASTGKVLLDRLGSQPTIPASTAKLITAASALVVLGPRTRLTTRVYAGAGTIYLDGGGDPTLSTQPAAVGYPPVADLGALARTVARRCPQVRCSGALDVIAVAPGYGGPDQAPGWSPSYLADGEVAPVRSLIVDGDKIVPGLGPSVRKPDPVLAAADTFRSALAFAGVKVGPAAGAVGAVPHGAKLLASVSSPPVSALVERMLNNSDADIAEGLGRQVALHSGQPGTFAGTAVALTQLTRRLGLPGSPQIMDGSGLSRADSVAPVTLTALLRDAVLGTHPQLRGLLAALPIAGFTGTLATRFTGTAAAGVGMVRAKTGWLNGAAALAGIVTTQDGRLLIFAALAPAQLRSSGEAALDRIAAGLAACGCR